MREFVSIWNDLSPTVRLVFAGIVGLIIAATVGVFAGLVAGLAAIGGLIVVGILLAIYGAILSARARKEAAPLEQSLAQSWGATPVGITEPARRARLDDLRKSFEQGVQTFRQAGKSLYALPWYVVVGEPGSGKTEAVRHSGVGFPPGLNDQYQGVGGTLNMNWWFTNHAVLLDTAGRLMFEEVQPGTTTEWQSFLKLLKKHRPSCPINGMLLVIPAESLIRDSVQDIQAKASKIATQLDTIQRQLGVRFPVFVVITKADLINGFREFFDKTTDPALQHQIFGWSNPEELDAPFKPAQVAEYLKSVQTRLSRRRLGMMIDPVNTDNPKARRTDQVDALYAFPESLGQIAPRLQKYLETIFVAGEWSHKPLFLRGIYFTSSMREGTALDADLAQALGVNVESLPEGKVWERDKAFFLRDLFMNKVFREKGLVTPAASTSKLQRARQAAVLGVAAAGVLLLATLTFVSARSLSKTIVGPSAFWATAGDAYLANRNDANKAQGTHVQMLPIVSKLTVSDDDSRYRGLPGDDANFLRDAKVSDETRKNRAEFMTEARERAAERLKVPLGFYPAAIVAGDTQGNILQAQRQGAARALFEASVLAPLVDAANVRLKADIDNKAFSPEAIDALAQLVRLESSVIAGESDKDDLLDLPPLFEYATRGNDSLASPEAKAGVKKLNETYQELFEAGAWPSPALKTRNWSTIARAAEDVAAWSAGQPAGVRERLRGLHAEFEALKLAAANVQPPEPLPVDLQRAADKVRDTVNARPPG